MSSYIPITCYYHISNCTDGTISFTETDGGCSFREANGKWMLNDCNCLDTKVFDSLKQVIDYIKKEFPNYKHVMLL